jgi:hypothetical protein
VEGFFPERFTLGSDIRHETVRLLWNWFGPTFGGLGRSAISRRPGFGAGSFVCQAETFSCWTAGAARNPIKVNKNNELTLGVTVCPP